MCFIYVQVANIVLIAFDYLPIPAVYIKDFTGLWEIVCSRLTILTDFKKRNVFKLSVCVCMLFVESILMILSLVCRELFRGMYCVLQPVKLRKRYHLLGSRLAEHFMWTIIVLFFIRQSVGSQYHGSNSCNL